MNINPSTPGQRSNSPDAKSIVAVASGKGGVGKSTVAVNLAVALAQKGLQVGLLDADIYGPNVPMMMGRNEAQLTSTENQKIRPIESYNVKIVSIGFVQQGDAAVIWRGPLVGRMIQQFLTDVDWGTLDYLIVDLPPGTGDAQLTLSQAVPLTGAVVVTTPQDVALSDAKKGVNMFLKVSVPVLGIVENMSYFQCPNCNHRTEIFSHGGAQEAAKKLNVPFLGEVPLDIRVREGGDTGKPIMTETGKSIVKEAFAQIADSLTAQIEAMHAQSKESVIGKVFKLG
jgi:ATP-binding protein involved in chromosome partitioning